MIEVKSEKGEALPKPLQRMVIIRNPLYGVDLEKVDKEIKQLAPNRQQAAYEKQMKVWEKTEIIAADEDSSIKAGDVCLTTASDAISAIKIMNGEFLMVRDVIFKAKW